MPNENNTMRPETPHSWGSERREWHLDKTISVGHLISTVTIALSVFVWAMALEKRVEQHAIQIQMIKESQVHEQSRLEAMRLEIKADNLRMEDKLDRLLQTQIQMREKLAERAN